MILLLKTYQKWFLSYHVSCSFKIFTNVFVFLYVNANSKETCEEISFSFFFFRKMVMSAFLLRFKAIYLKKMRCYPNFSSPCKDLLFPRGPNNLAQKLSLR